MGIECDTLLFFHIASCVFFYHLFFFFLQDVCKNWRREGVYNTLNLVLLQENCSGK